jgi:hypothetical protein
MRKIRSAALSVIVKAVGKKTGDELIAEREKEEKDALDNWKSSGSYLNAKQRKRLRRMQNRVGEL